MVGSLSHLSSDLYCTACWLENTKFHKVAMAPMVKCGRRSARTYAQGEQTLGNLASLGIVEDPRH